MEHRREPRNGLGTTSSYAFSHLLNPPTPGPPAVPPGNVFILPAAIRPRLALLSPTGGGSALRLRLSVPCAEGLPGLIRVAIFPRPVFPVVEGRLCVVWGCDQIPVLSQQTAILQVGGLAGIRKRGQYIPDGTLYVRPGSSAAPDHIMAGRGYLRSVLQSWPSVLVLAQVFASACLTMSLAPLQAGG